MLDRSPPDFGREQQLDLRETNLLFSTYIIFPIGGGNGTATAVPSRTKVWQVGAEPYQS